MTVSHSSTNADVVLLNTIGRRERLLALKLLDIVIDVLALPASRARSDPSRQLKPKTLKTHSGIKWQGNTKLDIRIKCLGFVLFSVSQASLAVDVIQFIHPMYEDREIGSVMTTMRETSRFSEGPVRKQNFKFERKAHRQLECWSRRLACAHTRNEQRLWFCGLPDSLIETISVTTCSKQFHHSQYNRALKGQTNLGRIVGGSTRAV